MFRDTDLNLMLAEATGGEVMLGRDGRASYVWPGSCGVPELEISADDWMPTDSVDMFLESVGKLADRQIIPRGVWDRALVQISARESPRLIVQRVIAELASPDAY